LTSLASLDYAYMSQAVMNQGTYLYTQLAPLKDKFLASQYMAEVDPDLAPKICVENF